VTPSWSFILQLSHQCSHNHWCLLSTEVGKEKNQLTMYDVTTEKINKYTHTLVLLVQILPTC